MNRVLILVAFLVFGQGCATRQAAPVFAKDAVIRAIRIFPEEKYGPIQKFEVKVIDHNEIWEEPCGPCWLVFFRMPEGPVGSHLMIEVSKKNGATRVIHGR